MAEERVQRRLAAVMAVDVVGYSRLMGDDEAGTLKTLKEIRSSLVDPAIREHRGRMVKIMGDGALVEFASVVDAVECANHIQRAMVDKNAGVSPEKQIEFRIGINLGDVIIEGRDIYGDGVNVAARLEGLAEPGGICISGTVFEHVKGKLDLSFDDLGPQEVKNIAEPVRVYRAQASPNDDTKLVPQRKDTPPTHNERPSIAVLPFDNLSNDPEQEYFSDGLAEDLITDISQISGLFVIARNSSFAFKGQAVDVKEIAKKLGVKHVVEGSVRKMGIKLRVNAQLIDAASGGHLWAQRYDGDMADVFEFQDSIREQIVSALQISLTPTDKALTEHRQTVSVEAYDLFLKGRATFHLYSYENLLAAMKCFEQAIEIDPHYADAYGYLSYCHLYGWLMMWPGFDETLDRANELAERGVALDSTSANAVMRLGWIQAWMRRYDYAIENMEKAIALAPDNAEIYASFGHVLNFWGDPARALEMSEKAFSLESFAPPAWEYYAGISHLLLRQYEEAIAGLQHMIERGPQFAPAYLWLACVYVELDRLDEARQTIKSALEIIPPLTIKEVSKRWPWRTDEDQNRILGALLRAGLSKG
jgi:TolB-like protein